jgi:tungstate transport system ATP-binding protein
LKSEAALLHARDLLMMRDGQTVLDVPDLQIHPGEIVSVIGPNGAGKTTLLLILSSVLKATHGRIFYRGRPISSGREALQYRRQQAMVFQEPLLFNASVFDNVASGLKLRNFPKDRIRELVEENLARFGISHLAGRSARNISGGEAQRTSLARAMATQPEVIFMDEPFAALDAPSREALIEDAGSALRGSGITAVIATHDRTEAMRLSTRMAVMESGRILQIGTPLLFSSTPPANLWPILSAWKT